MFCSKTYYVNLRFVLEFKCIEVRAFSYLNSISSSRVYVHKHPNKRNFYALPFLIRDVQLESLNGFYTGIKFTPYQHSAILAASVDGKGHRVQATLQWK